MNPLRSFFDRLFASPHLRDLFALWGIGLAIACVIILMVLLSGGGWENFRLNFKYAGWGELAFALAIGSMVVAWHSVRLLKHRRAAEESREEWARPRARTAHRSSRLLAFLAPAVALTVTIAIYSLDSHLNETRWILLAIVLLITLILYLNGFLPRSPR